MGPQLILGKSEDIRREAYRDGGMQAGDPILDSVQEAVERLF